MNEIFTLHWDITVYVSKVWSKNSIIFILPVYYVLIFLLPV